MLKKLLCIIALCFVFTACNKQQSARSDHAQKCLGVKLPGPNAEKPPIVGIHGFEFWEKTEMDIQNRQWHLTFNGKKYIILGPYILMDIETGEEIDLRTSDIIRPGSGGEFMR